ncbi:Uncharacterised protein [Acinetobacter baumannii]|nr:Uncharacterised protein [Acinetobacter baumannii]
MVLYGTHTFSVLLLPNIDCFSLATPTTVAGMLPTRITSPTTFFWCGNSRLWVLASITTVCACDCTCIGSMPTPWVKLMPYTRKNCSLTPLTLAAASTLPSRSRMLLLMLGDSALMYGCSRSASRSPYFNDCR